MSRNTISTTDCLRVLSSHTPYFASYMHLSACRKIWNTVANRPTTLKKNKISLHIFKIIYRYIQLITRYHSTKLSWEMISRLRFVGHYSCHVTRKTDYLFLPSKGGNKTWDVIHTANHGRRLSVLTLTMLNYFWITMRIKGLFLI